MYLIFLFNKSVSDQCSSEQFNELKKPVNIIDDDYMKIWISTDKEEKIAFFSKSDYNTIFQQLPALQHPLGYTLVSVSSFIILNQPTRILLF